MAVKEMAEPRLLISPVTSTAAQSSNFSTNVFNVQQFSNFGLQLVITSAAALNVAAKVQSSFNGTNWDDVPSSSLSFTTNGSNTWNYSEFAPPYVRVTFTFTAGSALFQVYGFAKQQ